MEFRLQFTNVWCHIHDGRSLHSLNTSTCKRRCFIQANENKNSSKIRPDTLFYIFFPGVLALTFYGLDYAGLAWKIKETSWNSPAQIQIYMAKSLIPLSGLLLTLQGVAEVFRCINCLKSGRWDEREDTDQETEKILMRTSQKEFKAK